MLNENIIKKTLSYNGNVTVLDTVDSTNDYAKLNSKNYGDVFLTNNQTKGKGRLGRTWICNNSLAMSVSVKPFDNPDGNLLIPLFAGYAVVNAVYELYGIKCMIKWPNDVVYNGKKLCGILNEAVTENGIIKNIICGIGINTAGEKLTKDITDKAISLESITGAEINENLLAAKICNQLFELTHKEPSLPNDFNDCVINIGKVVYIIKNDETLKGYAKKVCNNGGLLVEYPDGTSEIVTSGEVSVRGLYGYV